MSDLFTAENIGSHLDAAGANRRQAAFDWQLAVDHIHVGNPSGVEESHPLLPQPGSYTSKTFLDLVHEEDSGRFLRAIRHASKIRKHIRYRDTLTVRLRRPCGNWRRIEIHIQKIERSRTGQALRMIGTLLDADDLRVAKSRADALGRLCNALNQPSEVFARLKSTESLFQAICRASVEDGRFLTVWIGMRDDSSGAVVTAAAFDSRTGYLQLPCPAADTRIAFIQRLAEEALRNGRPFICDDLPRESGVILEDQEFTTLQPGSIGSFPFMRGGETVAVLVCQAAERHGFDEATRSILVQIARGISVALDNLDHEKRCRETEAALAASESLKTAIFSASLDAIVTIDEAGTIMAFNPAAESIFGYRAKDVLGEPLVDLIIPQRLRASHTAGMTARVQKGTANMEIIRREQTAVYANGNEFPIELAIVPLIIAQRTVYTAFIRDISAVKRSQEIFRDSARRYKQLVDLSPEAIFAHQNGKFILMNQAALRLFGAQTPEELIGRDIFDFVHETFHARVRERLSLPEKLSKNTAAPFVEELWRRLDGSWFNAEEASSFLEYDGTPAVQTVMRDISERKRKEELQGMQNHILSMVATGVPIDDILGSIAGFVEKHCERGMCVISMLDREKMVLTYRIASTLPSAYRVISDRQPIGPVACSAGSAAFRADPVIAADIAAHPVWRNHREPALAHGLRACSAYPIFGQSRKVLGTLSIYFTDTRTPDQSQTHLLTVAANLAGIAIEARGAEERVRRLAHYDELTSLPNRFLFKEWLAFTLEKAKRERRRFSVMFLDLDRFKNINDTFGHDAGDETLKEMSKRLVGCLRASDRIARMGGDEFYILIDPLDNPQDAAYIAQKVLKEASRSFYVGGQECQLSASIGIVMYPDDGTDSQTLLKNSDIAMYRAKSLGKNTYQFYTASKNDHTRERMALESRLRHAIDNNEFVLHYQPKIDLLHGRIYSVEALVRWQHPEKGLLPPAEFIGLAEETGLIAALGMKIIKMAYEASLELRDILEEPIRIAVNLSARQLTDPNFMTDVKAILGDAKPENALLDMEITESMMMHNPDQAAGIMNELEAIGVRLSIDDFGTGYSSLAYLKRFSVESLKIDRSFVQDVPDDPNDTAITQAIIAMAHSLGVRVIAEGVETKAQVEVLRKFGCDELQGYFFSRPVGFELLLAYLRWFPSVQNAEAQKAASR